MPPKTKTRHFDSRFHAFLLAIEKKISQLGTFLANLDNDKQVSEFLQRILVTHINRLRSNIDAMELEWENVRDHIPQTDQGCINSIVEESVTNGEASLVRAELFVCHAAQQ